MTYWSERGQILFVTLFIGISRLWHQSRNCWEGDGGHRCYSTSSPHHPVANIHIYTWLKMCISGLFVSWNLKQIPKCSVNNCLLHKHTLSNSHHGSDPKPYQASWRIWKPKPNRTVFLVPRVLISRVRKRVCGQRGDENLQLFNSSLEFINISYRNKQCKYKVDREQVTQVCMLTISLNIYWCTAYEGELFFLFMETKIKQRFFSIIS